MERTGIEQWRPREVARLLALLETERRYYQEMVAALPVGLVVLSQDRTIVSSNRAFRALAGLTGEELRQKSIEQILPSDELIERIRSAHVHADTQPFWISADERRFRVAAIPIRSWEDDAEAETLLMVEPAEGAAAPGEGAAPPRADLSGFPAAIWQADAATFAFRDARGSVEELLGSNAERALAEPRFFSERIHAQDREEVMAQYRRVAETGGETTAEFRTILPSGEARWVRETIRVPAPGPGGRRISGVTTQIRQRRTLEGLAAEAARVDALRALAARLAHDLNNPLTIVTGYSEEMLSGLAESDAKRGDLTEILAAARRLQELAASLLNFARTQAKPPAVIAMSEVLAALEQRLRGLAREVEFAFPTGSVWALADAGQLGEAVAAMAAFAIGSVTGASRLLITCGAEEIVERIGLATLRPGPYARLDLHAAGKGSGSAQTPFESILPVKGAPAAAADVARAYLNVRQWGGDILFSSGPEAGSTFTLYLPFAQPSRVEAPPAPAPAEEKSAPEPAPVTTAPAGLEPPLGTILLVEDEPGIRGLVRKILRRERYEVLEAGSAEEALALAKTHGGAIDLLLTDVMLPGMSGRELAGSLRAAYSGVKVIYVSGFTGDEEVRGGEFPPGSRFLQKPFTLSALVSAVKDAIGR